MGKRKLFLLDTAHPQGIVCALVHYASALPTGSSRLMQSLTTATVLDQNLAPC